MTLLGCDLQYHHREHCHWRCSMNPYSQQQPRSKTCLGTDVLALTARNFGWRNLLVVNFNLVLATLAVTDQHDNGKIVYSFQENKSKRNTRVKAPRRKGVEASVFSVCDLTCWVEKDERPLAVRALLLVLLSSLALTYRCQVGLPPADARHVRLRGRTRRYLLPPPDGSGRVAVHSPGIGGYRGLPDQNETGQYDWLYVC